MKMILIALLTVGCASLVRAEIKKQTVEYKQGATVLEGYLAYDHATKAPRPAVLIVHQCKGLTDFEKRRAEILAKLGYGAVAVDIYVQGIRPQTVEEAGA